MNGKSKIVASAAIGLAIAFSVIAGSNALSITFPSIFGPSVSTSPGSGQVAQFGTLVLTAKDAPPAQKQLLNLYIQIGDIVLHRAVGEEESSTTSSSTTASTTQPEATSTTAASASPSKESAASKIACKLTPEPESFDVIALKSSGLEAYLGQCQVPEGNYVMIEFQLGSASAVFQGSSDKVKLTTPSDSLKVPVHFTIKAGKITGVTLDFQADQFQVNVNDVLRPVVVGLLKHGPTDKDTTTTTTA